MKNTHVKNLATLIVAIFAASLAAAPAFARVERAADELADSAGTHDQRIIWETVVNGQPVGFGTQDTIVPPSELGRGWPN
jgi:hypothetical protein